MAVPARVFIQWTTYTGVTFSGPAVVQTDAANGNRPYTWFIVPANTLGYVAFTSSGNAGPYYWYYTKAVFANCATTVGLPVGTPPYDFCWNIEFDATTLKYTIQISTTQYTPIRYRFELAGANNAVLQGPGGGAVTSPYTVTVAGRPPPTGSTVPGRIIGYIASAGSGVNSWYNFGFNHWYSYGDPLAVTTPSTTLYSFPFIGSFTVLQGNGGTVSHNVGGINQYALDFSMPLGTPIYAARAGYVSLVEESNSQSAYVPCPSNPGACNVTGAFNNYIRVIHPDRTIGAYNHIRQNGAVVVPGQNIVRGQLLGYSGNTGQAPSPQLHFAVYRINEVQSTNYWQSIQVFYNNGSGTPFIPTQGSLVEWYNGAPRAAPVAPPVAAPKAAPVAAPMAPPIMATPVDSPVDAPVGFPVDSPVDSPATVPLAEPVAEPAAEPVSAPEAVPEAAPIAAPYTSYNPLAAPRAAPIASPPRAAPTSTGASDPPRENPVSDPSPVGSSPSPIANEAPTAVSLTSSGTTVRSDLFGWALFAFFIIFSATAF
eukprot:TRINITY_DN318_c0_g1_i2.p1 TRINITY_DN318_c0_g1~~TRINITY_DN318_c0_g1_i2.p1  ORF type:complete len:540 (+),score=83.12 TRINITY_DN318_c0_g1_i2:377-1996(+)